MTYSPAGTLEMARASRLSVTSDSDRPTLGVLSVGAGDTKLSFDKNNPAERIRSARIVTDMLRRGYALLIEVDDGNGGMKTTRVREFREDVCEYIIADFDPEIAARADEEDGQGTQGPRESSPAEGAAQGDAQARKAGNASRRSYTTRAIAAEGVSGVAVARSAGG